MTLKQTVMLGLFGGALVTLFTRVTFSVAPLPDPHARTPPGVAASRELAVEIDRLHERWRTPVRPLRSARNPFAYAAAPAPARMARPAERSLAAPAPEALGAVRAPARPAFTLVGLAEDATATGPVRTAIVTGPSGLQFVGVGDALGPYRVIAIREAAIEIGVEGAAPVVLELE